MDGRQIRLKLTVTRISCTKKTLMYKKKESDGRERGWNSWVGAQQPPSNLLQQLPQGFLTAMPHSTAPHLSLDCALLAAGVSQVLLFQLPLNTGSSSTT